jgi:hypothetical protein
MSLVLIGISVLLVALVFWRVATKAKSAIRRWADEYGYRVDSASFHAAFSAEFQEAGREAEIVYRVVLSSPSGDRSIAYFLLWNMLVGRTTVVVRWEAPSGDVTRS